MMLRFTPDATTAQREAVVAALRKLDVDCVATDGTLVLDGALSADDAVAVAALPGVAEIRPGADGQTTVREAILFWAAGAAVVLGVLFLFAANLPATLGRPAVPLRTPGALRPSWPLLPWYAAVDKSPTWAQAPLLLAVAALALFFWPSIGRRLAEKRPWIHALIGVAALAAVAGLAVLEAVR